MSASGSRKRRRYSSGSQRSRRASPSEGSSNAANRRCAAASRIPALPPRAGSIRSRSRMLASSGPRPTRASSSRSSITPNLSRRPAFAERRSRSALTQARSTGPTRSPPEARRSRRRSPTLSQSARVVPARRAASSSPSSGSASTMSDRPAGSDPSQRTARQPVASACVASQRSRVLTPAPGAPSTRISALSATSWRSSGSPRRPPCSPYTGGSTKPSPSETGPRSSKPDHQSRSSGPSSLASTAARSARKSSGRQPHTRASAVRRLSWSRNQVSARASPRRSSPR